jgi:hypothetical protein
MDTARDMVCLPEERFWRRTLIVVFGRIRALWYMIVHSIEVVVGRGREEIVEWCRVDAWMRVRFMNTRSLSKLTPI